MVDKIKENRFAVLLLLTGAVYFFLKVLAPLTAPVLTAFPETMKQDVLAFLAKIGNRFSESAGG